MSFATTSLAESGERDEESWKVRGYVSRCARSCGRGIWQPRPQDTHLKSSADDVANDIGMADYDLVSIGLLVRVRPRADLPIRALDALAVAVFVIVRGAVPRRGLGQARTTLIERRVARPLSVGKPRSEQGFYHHFKIISLSTSSIAV